MGDAMIFDLADTIGHDVRFDELLDRRDSSIPPEVPGRRMPCGSEPRVVR